MAYRLIEVTVQRLALFGRQLLCAFPVVVIEATTIGIRDASSLVAVTRAPAALWGVLLLQDAVHLCAVHATEPCVDRTHGLAVTCWHGCKPIRVVVADLEVDHVVTRNVSQRSTFGVEMLPRGQVLVELVVTLVQDKEAQFRIVQRVHERTAIPFVSPVGTRCGYAVVHFAITDHQHTSQRDILGVTHDVHHRLGHPLFSG